MAHNTLEAIQEPTDSESFATSPIFQPLQYNTPAPVCPVAAPVEDCGETIEYYYDWHPTEEDLMGQSEPQARVIHYMLEVLHWLYRVENWYIAADLNIYRSRNKKENPVVPDIAVFKGVVVAQVVETTRRGIRSWSLPMADRPSPQVVFEFASEGTWRKDLYFKPKTYAKMGVSEYFFFDPRSDGEAVTPRLRGWRTNNAVATRMLADERGWLWSDELESWLAAEGEHLRLRDANGVMRLTGEEAERAAKEQERAAKERAWAKLQELGFDPDDLA